MYHVWKANSDNIYILGNRYKVIGHALIANRVGLEPIGEYIPQWVIKENPLQLSTMDYDKAISYACICAL